MSRNEIERRRRHLAKLRKRLNRQWDHLERFIEVMSYVTLMAVALWVIALAFFLSRG